MFLAPPALSATSPASSVSATSGISATGSALAMEPPTVPRLRVWGWPTKRSALASSGALARTSGERSAAAWRVQALITREVSSPPMP